MTKLIIIGDFGFYNRCKGDIKSINKYNIKKFVIMFFQRFNAHKIININLAIYSSQFRLIWTQYMNKC